ncbi:MAG: aspartate--tRNA(Asn) ligase [Bacilli bacterium]|nr:aspartate--tRNA(Asn) ligase [Bacilli bacterium]MDD4718877.1 aspartate--tRNA(Asn) ligase [Bacilli bacterium]
MKKIYIKELNKYYGKEVIVKAFVDKIRDLQYVQFVILRDSSGKVQLILEKNEDNKEMVEIISNLTLESTVTITGEVLENPKVKLGGLEIIPTNIVITSRALPELPIDINDKEKSLRETRLDYRFLDLRRAENNLFFKAQTLILKAMREYWVDNGFIEIQSPKISGGNAESGAEVFKLDYFGTDACLSQSPQFYKQMAMAAGFDNVFEIAPAFRAENSHTSYHATEIFMVDAEISWIDSFEDVMDMQEAWIKYSLDKLRDAYALEIKETFNVEISNTDVKFPRITFDEAKRIIKEKYNYVAEKTDDFERKEEELLCQYVKENFNSDFVFVTKFPKSSRSFYHNVDEEGYSNSFDLIYKGVEITTGAQREHRPEILERQAIEKGIDPETIRFYIDFFNYGCPPHGGFGFGMARLMMKIFELDNIREATFLYRGPNRLTP